MQENTQKEILNLVQNLREIGKKHLAQCIQENWHKTLKEYTAELNVWTPPLPLEQELENAFRKELKRLEKNNEEEAIIKFLKEKRILQTAPHLSVTLNPRMLTIEWLSSLGVQETDYRISAVYSGIPFSNSSRSGKIENINLFPSNMQDALVYRSTIPNKFFESLEKVPEQIKNILTPAKENESYTKWAMQNCEKIEKKLFQKDNIVLLDINEIIANYLEVVLKEKEHPVYKILFDQETRSEFLSLFKDEIIFYKKSNKGKYENTENMYLTDTTLKSKNAEIPLTNEDEIIDNIKKGILCPALILVFIPISFINSFKCFGSFIQVEYLTEYKEKLAKMKAFKKYNVSSIPTENLTTGSFKDFKQTSTQMIEHSLLFNPNPETIFGEILLEIKELLLKLK